MTPERDMPRAGPVDLREQHVRVDVRVIGRIEVANQVPVLEQADALNALAIGGLDPDPQVAGVALAAEWISHRYLRPGEVPTGAFESIAVADVGAHRGVGRLV